MQMNEPKIDHVALNVRDLDQSIAFYAEMFGFKLIRRWDAARQAFVGRQGIVLGLIEAPEFDFGAYTRAHLTFSCDEGAFPSFLEKVKELGLEIVAGPKGQRGGETVLFRDPSGNILEVCYPPLQEWVTRGVEATSGGDVREGQSTHSAEAEAPGEHPKLTFEDIEMAYQFVSSSPYGEHEAVVRRSTGEILWRSEMGDMDEISEEISDEELDSEDCVAIPHKNDLDMGKRLVLDFVRASLPEDYDRVRQIFGRRGAYGRFKELLERKGMLEYWYEFESQENEKALRDWCRENGIGLSD